ncbi:nucleotidyltransferase family protein [Pseudoalteromonas sp. NEC-BIFX-2020_002]|uniref:nucleotidyltransferase family protein n=1 Tax=Pseudoalteromonas sp. NEC-BIFX-2020_002 TaxID=2732353 RepID=UPI001BB2C18D|nr:nucleotidyltransferase family protein [Pseudoalteromonas sp. NEC-BIFX-2020_002]
MMENRKEYLQVCISSNISVLDAMKKMDEVRKKLLITIDESGKYVTLISIGDVQRAILQGVNLSLSVSELKLDRKIVASTSDSMQDISDLMKKIRAEFMPVLDGEGNIIKVVFWEELINQDEIKPSNQYDVPVVIMAGGKGTRLKPLSNVLPKPLTPIGEKTILEEIMSRFENAGSNDFYMSVNYKKEMIEYYLNSVNQADKVSFFEEDKPLGTAGSLSLLKGKIDKTFYVTNCDILIEQDLGELYEYHQRNQNEITLVSALKTLSIPYGTIQSGKDGILESMEEKPQLTFKINAGVYILEPHLLNEIPENEFYHITDLIASVNDRGGRVGVFPISEKSWLDIGEWPEYIKTVRMLSGEEQFRGL